MRNTARPSARGFAVTATLGCAVLLASAVPSLADTYVLKDGREVSGRTLREKDGFVYVKTLGGIEKLNLAQVTSQTEGPSALDEWETLRKASAADKASAPAQWALYAFLAAHRAENDTFEKEARKLLKNVLKLDPDHVQARDAAGQVKFKGDWVNKVDLPRLKAEAERRALRREWQGKLGGVSVSVEKSEHFLMVDGTDEKDLGERAQALEEAYDILTELLGREQLWAGMSPTITLDGHDDYLTALEKYQEKWRMSEAWLEFARAEKGGGVWRDRPEPTQLRFPSSGAEGMWYATVHNVAHLAIWKMWGGKKTPPTWLEEGLGEWIEAEVMGGNLASCVGLAARRGKDDTTDKPRKKKGRGGKSLRETQNEWKEICIEAVQDGTFPPLRKFMNMQMGDYGPAEEGGALGLVTWLIQKDREKFGELCARLVHPGRRQDDPFTETLGYELIEEMEKEWKTWVLTEW